MFKGTKWEDRMGRLFVPTNVLNNYPMVIPPLFTDCIVVRAEMMFERDGIEYTAAHPDFEPVLHGNTIPHYTGRFENVYDETGENVTEIRFLGWTKR